MAFGSLYLVLALGGLLSALMILAALNPVHRIALLVALFLVGSFLFILLDYYFLGLTYIIVYCGAIAIIFLFVIMMVAQSQAQSQSQPYYKTRIAAMMMTPLLA